MNKTKIIIIISPQISLLLLNLLEFKNTNKFSVMMLIFDLLYCYNGSSVFSRECSLVSVLTSRLWQRRYGGEMTRADRTRASRPAEDLWLILAFMFSSDQAEWVMNMRRLSSAAARPDHRDRRRWAMAFCLCFY